MFHFKALPSECIDTLISNIKKRHNPRRILYTEIRNSYCLLEYDIPFWLNTYISVQCFVAFTLPTTKIMAHVLHVTIYISDAKTVSGKFVDTFDATPDSGTHTHTLNRNES